MRRLPGILRVKRKRRPYPEGVCPYQGIAREAAMTCEQCHALMIERLPARENQDSDKEQAVVLECPQCGHTEYQPLITSFWRRLAA
jgi:ssDNA-binding Zn-finger/Zn-ribbon topoisomerase 1